MTCAERGSSSRDTVGRIDWLQAILSTLARLAGLSRCGGLAYAKLAHGSNSISAKSKIVTGGEIRTKQLDGEVFF